MKKLILKKLKNTKINIEYALNTSDSARFLGVSESLLRKLRSLEKGPKYSKIGNRVVYSIPELKLYVENNSVKVTK